MRLDFDGYAHCATLAATRKVMDVPGGGKDLTGSAQTRALRRNEATSSPSPRVGEGLGRGGRLLRIEANPLERLLALAVAGASLSLAVMRG